MKKLFVTSLVLMLIAHFSVVEYKTFENANNGYHGLLVTLDEPVRKIFEKIELYEIEFPNKYLISFNTLDY